MTRVLLKNEETERSETRGDGFLWIFTFFFVFYQPSVYSTNAAIYRQRRFVWGLWGKFSE